MKIRISVATLVAAITLVPLTAVAQDAEQGVVSDTISHELTTNIHVWAPDGPGPYPIVWALHGTGVDYGRDFDVLATHLAKAGIVTFAPDYHASDWQLGRGDRVEREGECGYRYVRQIAQDYGGSTDEPVAFLGHSIGGTYALAGALNVDAYGPDGTYEECFEGAPRPDLVIPLAACHFEAHGRSWELDPATYGTGDASLLFIGAENDDECAAWQSVDAAAVFAGAGFESSSTVVPAATHLGVMGHAVVDDEWVSMPDDPAVMAVAQTIIEAIDRS